MSEVWIRPERSEDAAAIAALNTAAFGGLDEARIVERLRAEGDSLLSLVAHDDRALLGHIQFFPILIDGAPGAAGLGPMCVAPARQREGVGAGLIRFGLMAMEGRGIPIVFVLGHPDYYPKFGFSAARADGFTAPWSGPAFMARAFGADAPLAGRLTYPAAFGA